ncbi:MAG: hypothetical protein JXR61_04230 [Prolixibacteraceae bacterium]|nr:hypothetical protein [Prolixibacteraceae bacterium]
MALSKFFTNLWNNVKSSPTFVPTYIEFPANQTDIPYELVEFDDRRDYFMMSVSELFLSYKRLWHQDFSPMVFTVCSFNYGDKAHEVPYVIGPSLLQKYEQRLPKGMLFLNTPVVGIYPWRGGNVSLSVILCRVAQTNNAEKLLNIVEEVSGSLDLSAGITQFSKMGRVVLKGLDTLLGFEQTSPLLGLNNNFGQESGNTFKPGFHALIHGENLDKSKFWVKKNKLHYGSSLEDSEEYRDNDFVLFKIGKTDKRLDDETLPYYQEYKEIYNYLSNQTAITDKEREFLRTKMIHLVVSIKQSNDLTPAHAEIILKEKIDEINKFVETLSLLGDKEKTSTLSEVDKMMDSALGMINF